MEERLTTTQLEEIVARVERLAERRDSELSREQVSEILADLHLPPELLDEALVQLQREKALKVQQKRRNWLIGSALGLIALIVVSTTFFTQKQQAILEQVTAQSDRLTLAQDRGENLSTVSRQAGNELFYRITLSSAPIGQKLALSCRWYAPDGQLVHTNNYTTKEITQATWNTLCRHQVDVGAPTGEWRVEAFLGDRQLSEATFTVQ
jgi:hypothetical protein